MEPPASSPTQAPSQWVGVSAAGRKFEIIACTFYTASCILVILRLVARLKQFRRLYIDDYMTILAQAFGFGMMIIAIILVEHAGIGWHIEKLPPAQIVEYYRLFYSAEICYQLTSISYKLAIVFLYLRVFGEIKSFKIASWIMVAFVISWGSSQVLAAIFQCTPIATSWDPTIPGHCINRPAFILGNGITNMFIDLAIIVMPLPVVWTLHLTWRKKFAISGIFMLGAIVMIASVLRITTILPFNLADGTHSLYGVALWSDIELPIGIIAACLPTLRQFFFGNTHGTSTGGSSKRFTSRGRTNLDSNADRTDTAIALTGWKSNGAYTEVASKETSVHHKPSSTDLEKSAGERQVGPDTFLDDASPFPEEADPRHERDKNQSSNAIHVDRRGSVRYE